MAKILLVDDDEAMRLIVSNFLYVEGYEVVSAANGEAAIKMARKEQPDAIVMDLNMPVMDGFAATREMKKDDALKNIPILILTGEEATQNYEVSYDVGADGYLAKPVDFEQLAKRLSKLLG